MIIKLRTKVFNTFFIKILKVSIKNKTITALASGHSAIKGNIGNSRTVKPFSKGSVTRRVVVILLFFTVN